MKTTMTAVLLFTLLPKLFIIFVLNMTIVKALIDSSADIIRSVISGRYPFSLAPKHNRQALATIMVNNGSNFNGTSEIRELKL